MSCGVGCRRGSDPSLLWLWRRLVATAPIRRLVWEPPYATGAALEKAKRQRKRKKVAPFTLPLPHALLQAATDRLTSPVCEREAPRARLEARPFDRNLALEHALWILSGAVVIL